MISPQGIVYYFEPFRLTNEQIQKFENLHNCLYIIDYKIGTLWTLIMKSHTLNSHLLGQITSLEELEYIRNEEVS